FHPTFLYEMLWSVSTIVVLLWAERRFKLKQGSLLLMYFISYGTIRFLLEFVRTDTSFRLLGMSRNGWVALLVVIASSVILWMRETGRLGAKAPGEDEVVADASDEIEEEADATE
ncbi:prolipoprotein diacylglyceryl transferase, partial [bacterium]|nr:prolipoprotein diacylglyceryl transferase [bacterium]